jgi:hypothetical protein
MKRGSPGFGDLWISARLDALFDDAEVGVSQTG